MKRKILIILLALSYVVTSTEVQELFKLPVFFLHFWEHNEQQEEISFSEYIQIHYFDEFIADEDVARDMELPFKDGSLYSSLNSQFLGYILPANKIVPILSTHTQNFVEVITKPSNGYAILVWNPPKQG